MDQKEEKTYSDTQNNSQTGRGYRNGPFNDYTKDAAVQTEHDPPT